MGVLLGLVWSDHISVEAIDLFERKHLIIRSGGPAPLKERRKNNLRSFGSIRCADLAQDDKGCIRWLTVQ